MILRLASIFWICFVALSYFVTNKSLYIHSFNKYWDVPGILTFGTFIFILIFGLVFLLIRKVQSLKVWHLILLFIILLPIIGTIRFEADTFAIYRGIPLESEGELYLQTNDPVVNPEQSKAVAWQEYRQYFEIQSTQTAFLNIAEKIFVATGFALLVLLIIYTIGFWFSRLIKEGVSPLIKFGLGTLTLSLILFLLAKTSLLDKSTLAIVAMLAIASSFSALKEIVSILSQKILLGKIESVLLSAGFFIFAFNFIEVVEPLPAGYDDYSYYLNLPKLLAEHGAYVHSYYPYAFALIQSFILILSGSLAATKTLSLFFAIASLLACHSFFKKFSPKNSAALLTLIFIAIPTIFVHSYLQLKTEFPMIFFSILALQCFYDFLKNKSLKWIFLAGLFAGFAFSIKLTAALLAAALLLMLLFEFKIKYVVILFLGLAITVLPWGLSNMSLNRQISWASLTSDSQTDLPVYNNQDLKINPDYCIANGAADADYDRYMGEYDSKIIKYLLLPWDSTMKISAKSFVTNIGFILLALCPFALLGIRKKDKIHKIFFAGALFYWFLWLLLGKGVIWYGMSGFLFLLIFMSMSFEFFKEIKARKILFFTVTIFIAASLFLRTNMFLQRSQVLMPYLSGMANETEYINYQGPNILYMAALLNSEPDSIIYMSNHAVLKYFINKSDQRVIFDPYLDNFTCLYQDKNDDALLERFKIMGVDYLVLIPSEDFSTSFVKEAQAEALKFANEKLQLVISYNSTYIYKII